MKNRIKYDVIPYNFTFNSFGEDNYCFLVAYFNALNYFNYDLRPLFIYIKQELKTNSDTLVCSCMYRNDYAFQVNSKLKINIDYIKLDRIKDFLPRTKEELTKGNLVIPPFIAPKSYDSITKEKSEGNNNKHYALIYGFDDYKKEIDMLNHIKNVSMVYRNCRIKYRNYIKSHYKAVINKIDNYSMYVIKKQEKEIKYSSNDLRTIFTNVVLNDKENIDNNFYCFLNYMNNLNLQPLKSYKVVNSLTAFINFFDHERIINEIIESCCPNSLFLVIKHIKLLRNIIFKNIYKESKENISLIEKEQKIILDNAKEYFEYRYKWKE